MKKTEMSPRNAYQFIHLMAWMSLLACYCLSGSAKAEVTIGGQARNLLVVPWWDNKLAIVDQNGFRLDLQSVSEDGRLRFRGTLDLGYSFGGQTAIDLVSELTGPGGLAQERLDVNLYRAFLQYRDPTSKLELSMGRQRIAWGTGLVLRPSDAFEPTDYFDPYRELGGVNAIRLRIPTSKGLYVDGIARISDTTNRLQLAAALGFRVTDVIELALSGVHDGIHGREQLGLTMQGNGIFQYWLDSAFRVQIRDTSNIYADPQQLLVEAGLGYTIPLAQGLKISAEYLFLSNGETLDTSGHLADAWADFRVLQARNYAFLQVELQGTERVGVTLSALSNIDDGSFHIRPGLIFRPLDGLELLLETQLFAGRLDGEFQRTELTEVSENVGLASLRMTWDW